MDAGIQVGRCCCDHSDDGLPCPVCLAGRYGDPVKVAISGYIANKFLPSEPDVQPINSFMNRLHSLAFGDAPFTTVTGGQLGECQRFEASETVGDYQAMILLTPAGPLPFVPPTQPTGQFHWSVLILTFEFGFAGQPRTVARFDLGFGANAEGVPCSEEAELTGSDLATTPGIDDVSGITITINPT